MNRMRELGISGAWADGEEAELFRLSRALFNARGGLFGFPSKFGDVQDRYDEIVMWVAVQACKKCAEFCQDRVSSFFTEVFA